MASPRRAAARILLVVAVVASASVLVPLRVFDESADALPAAAVAMHGAGTCSSSMSELHDSTAHGGMLMPGPASCNAFRPAISMKGWSISASSSAKAHPASAALQAGAKSWWQSKSPRKGFTAQTLTLHKRTAAATTGLQYRPASGRGAIGLFEVQLSKDGKRFGAIVARGRWERASATKQVGWSPTRVRAVKITIRSVSPSTTKTVTAAALGLTGVASPSSAPPAPAQPTVTPTAQPTQSTPAEPTATSSAQPFPSDSPMRSATPTPTPTPTARPSGSPAVEGRWGPTIAFPMVPVAAASIPGNRLVVWAADEDMSFDSSNTTASTQTAVVNLTTGAVSATRVSSTGHDMFCPGVSMLADGRILVSGGISNRETSVYDPATDSWTAGPRMNIGRGYQGQTTLSDGRAFTIGGSWSGELGGKLGEVYTPGGKWRVLPSVTTDPIVTDDVGGIVRSDNHAWLVSTSSGGVLQAGPSKQMNWISTIGDGAISAAGVRSDAGDQMNGNAVLFDVNKVLTVGGATSYQDVDATGAADVLDLSAGFGRPVAVSRTGSLVHPRSYANSVVLPDGSVVTIGGMSHPVPFSDTGSVLTPELWDETSGSWTEMADEAEPRNYHSVAVLLPDGTVFSGGGGLCGAGCAANHPTGQIFSPPYLFNRDGSSATRPTISGVPATADPAQDITVTASSSAARFVLVRDGESTHSVDNDQRRVPLAIQSRSASSATLSIPADNGVVLPGRYMLFALTSSGVPSISAPILITVKG